MAVLVLAATTCFLFRPLVLGALTGSPRFLEWDVPEQYWPDQVYLCGALFDGELPLWNPYDRAGYPYYADPQSGAYHPLSWALCAVGGRSPGLGWAELRVVLGFFLAGVFGLLWLRRWSIDWGPALLGAVILQAAPFMRHNWELNLTTALAYLPLMLWAADRAVVERRARDGVVLALAVALGAWVGSPPALWLSLSFVTAFTVCRLSAELSARGRAILLPSLLTLGVAAVATAGLIGAVVIPGLRLASHSVQAGRSFSSIAEGGLSPNQLSALVWPQSGNHLYVGLLALALAPLALLVKGATSARHGSATSPLGGAQVAALPARWFFVGMAVTAVLLTLGTHSPLFKLGYDWVPGVALFRIPHRYEAWLGPCLAALAAGGLSWTASREPLGWIERHVTLTRALAGAAFAAGLTWALLGPGWGPATLLLGGGIVALAATTPRLGSTHLVVGAALAVLLLLDVSQKINPNRHTVRGARPPSTRNASAVFAKTIGTDHRWRYLDEFGVSCRSGTRHGRRDFRGYQDPLLLKSYERVLASLRTHPRLAEQFNVRYALTGPHYIHRWNRHFLPPPRELLRIPGARNHGHGVIELPKPVPPAYWVPLRSVKVAPDRPAALERLKVLAPGPVAILDGAVDGPGQPAAPTKRLTRMDRGEETTSQVAASGFRLGRDRLSFRIHAPGPGVVVINEAWYPGWQAFVNGKRVPVYRANALVRAVFVEPGRHRITMRFRPTEGILLRWLLLVTLVSCLGLLGWSFWSRRRQ
ncbi:MAG: hypothetical protein ABI333_02380 [bacterium]